MSFYWMIISACGFLLLSTLSIASFSNQEALKLNPHHNVKIGFCLLVSAMVFF